MTTNTVTLKDLASILGVSISTVSKALNDSHEISPKTKKRVVKLATSLKYKPNFHAKSLRSNRSLVLGVILPCFKSDFFLEMLNGIAQETAKHNYKIMAYQSCEDFEKEITYANLLLESNLIDGLIFTPVDTFDIEKRIACLHKFVHKNIPVLFFDKNRITKNSIEKGYSIGQDSVKELLKNLNASVLI